MCVSGIFEHCAEDRVEKLASSTHLERCLPTHNMLRAIGAVRYCCCAHAMQPGTCGDRMERQRSHARHVIRCDGNLYDVRLLCGGVLVYYACLVRINRKAIFRSLDVGELLVGLERRLQLAAG